MSEKRTITCDGCGKEIRATTPFEYESYLELRPVWKGHRGGAVLATGFESDLEAPEHFHGYSCIEAKIDADRAERKRREELAAADPEYELDFSTIPPRRIGRRYISSDGYRCSTIWGADGDPEAADRP